VAEVLRVDLLGKLALATFLGGATAGAGAPQQGYTDEMSRLFGSS